MPRAPKRLHPLNPGASFGFEAIMRQPDYARFPDWYRETSRLGGKR